MQIENTQRCTIELPRLAGKPAQVLKPGVNEVEQATWTNGLKSAAVQMYMNKGYLKVVA